MNERKTLIVDTFLKAVSRRTNKDQLLQNGLVLRNQFQETLRQGQIPNHARFEWLRRQARTMLELLLVMAADYDKAPTGQDRISMADLLDICGMTQGHVSGIINQGFIDVNDVKLLPFEQIKPELDIFPARGEDDDEKEP